MPTPIEIPSSNIRVDDFGQRVPLYPDKTYLLTHFHADHYRNLGPRWKGAKILCNSQTARLVIDILGVSRDVLIIVPMCSRFKVSKDVDVYFADANHCPGAAIVVFFVSQKVYIHTGDFRASNEMIDNDTILSSLCKKKGEPEAIYLDTTYAHPKHSLPDRRKCIHWIGDLFQRKVLESKERVLFVVMTYLMGKERILEEIEQRMSSDDGIFLVSEKKGRVLKMLDNLSSRFKKRLRIVDEETSKLETTSSAPVQVVSWGKAGQFVPGGWRFDADFGYLSRLQKNAHAERTIVIIPTGWVYSKKSDSDLGIQSQRSESGNIELHLVPYSEHSSYDDLRNFVKRLKPVSVVPTVVSFQKSDTAKQRESKILKVTKRFSDLIDRGSLKRKRMLELFGSGVGKKAKKEKISKQASKKESWACARCTFLNENRQFKCEMCESPRFSSKALSIERVSKKKNESPELRTVSLKKKKKKSELKTVSLPSSKEKTSNASFSTMCQTLKTVADTTKRSLKMKALVEYFKTLLVSNKEAVRPAFLLFTNTVASEKFRGGTHTGKRDNGGDIGIGGSMVSRCICEALGIDRAKLRETYRKVGDLGDAAAELLASSGSSLKNSKRQKLLTSFFRSPEKQQEVMLSVEEVFEKLRLVANTSGEKSEERKRRILISLIRRCRTKPVDIRFLSRILISSNRCGASTTTMLCAISRASLYISHKSEEEITKDMLKRSDDEVKYALAIHPSLSNIANAIVHGGREGMLNLAVLRVKNPICPMLASPAHSLKEVIEWIDTPNDENKDDTFTLEYKYDGARCQIHCVRNTNTKKWEIQIFSRHLSDVTSKYPEAVESIRQSISSDSTTLSLILDGEVCAVSRDPLTKLTKILPFQTLTTTSNKSQLCVYLFDCLMKNNTSLLKESLRNRRRYLLSSVVMLPGCVEFVKHVNLTSADESLLSVTLEESVSSGCEGLMAKALSSPYKAGLRGGNFWKKVKADYVGKGVCDSLDVVPIGAWHGNGRKAGWLSPVLVAVYDEETEMYQSIGRIMSGLSDEFYKKITENWNKLITHSKPHNVQTNERCSMWFVPPDSSDEEITTGVWEVRGADLTISKVHTAGSRGLGLRFPRFVRERPDLRTRSGLTTSCDIDAMFSKQQQNHQKHSSTTTK